MCVYAGIYGMEAGYGLINEVSELCCSNLCRKKGILTKGMPT